MPKFPFEKPHTDKDNNDHAGETLESIRERLAELPEKSAEWEKLKVLEQALTHYDPDPEHTGDIT